MLSFSRPKADDDTARPSSLDGGLSTDDADDGGGGSHYRPTECSLAGFSTGSSGAASADLRIRVRLGGLEVVADRLEIASVGDQGRPGDVELGGRVDPGRTVARFDPTNL